MKEPQQYQLKENPSIVYSCMKVTDDNFVQLNKWCRNIYKDDSGALSLGRTIPLKVGDWILHDEGKGYFWTYGKGAGGDGFLLDYQPYEDPEARAKREADEAELHRVDL